MTKNLPDHYTSKKEKQTDNKKRGKKPSLFSAYFSLHFLATLLMFNNNNCHISHTQRDYSELWEKEGFWFSCSDSELLSFLVFLLQSTLSLSLTFHFVTQESSV